MATTVERLHSQDMERVVSNLRRAENLELSSSAETSHAQLRQGAIKRRYMPELRTACSNPHLFSHGLGADETKPIAQLLVRLV